MDKTVREYIKKVIQDDGYVHISNGNDTTASVGVCHAKLGDLYTVDVVCGGFFGRTYEYETLSKCFARLSRMEREKGWYWEIPKEARSNELRD